MQIQSKSFRFSPFDSAGRARLQSARLQRFALFGIACMRHRQYPTVPMAVLVILGCGCSSGVEHNLAKVGVVGSNPIARSNKFNKLDAVRLGTLLPG
jgi:hypothetical protein